MVKRRLKILVGGLILLGGLFSCEKETLKPYVLEPSDEPISYSGEIQPIFNSNCVSCHGGGIAPNLNADVSYNSLIEGNYLNIDDPASSELVVKLSTGSHASRASAIDKQKIQLWIEQGAENN